MLQLPAVQKVLVDRVSNYLESTFDANVQVRAIDISFFDAVDLNDVLIRDHQNDTMVFIKELELSFDAVFSKKPIINKVNIKEADLRFLTHPEDSLNNISIFINAFAGGDSNANSEPFALQLEAISIENSKLVYESSYDVSEVDVEIENVSIVGDHIAARIDEMSFYDNYSHGRLKHLESDLMWSNQELSARKVQLTTDRSSMALHALVSGNFSNGFSIYDSTHTYQVSLLKGSTIHTADVKWFVPSIEINELINIHFDINGNANKLLVRDLELYNKDRSFAFDFDGQVEKLDSNLNPFIQGAVKQLSMGPRFVRQLYRNTPTKIPTYAANMEYMSMSMFMDGYLNDFSADFKISSNYGFAKGDVNIIYDSLISYADYNGDIELSDFDLGQFTGSKDIGKVNVHASVDGSGLTMDLIRTEGDVVLSKLDFKGYEYNDIHFQGLISPFQLDGSLSIKDPNLDLDFSGRVNFREHRKIFDFNTDLNYANLYKLGLYDKDSIAILSSSIAMNFSASNIDDIEGIIDLQETSFETYNDYLNVSDFKVEASKEGENRNLDVESDIVTATIYGTYNFQDLPVALDHAIARYFTNYTVDAPWQKVDLLYDISVLNAIPITKTFFPDFFIESGTRLYGNFKNRSNTMDLAFRCPEFGYKGQRIKDLKLNTHMLDEGLWSDLSIKELSYTKDLKVDSISLVNVLRSDSCFYKLTWDYDYNFNNSGALNGYLTVGEEQEVVVSLDSSSFNIAGVPWTVIDGNRVEISRDGVRVDSLGIYRGKQRLIADGKLSKSASEVMSIYFDKFDLSTFNEYLSSKSNTVVNGIADGSMAVENVYYKPLFEGALTIDDFAINSHGLGQLKMSSHLDTISGLIAVNAVVQSGRAKSLELDGVIDPDNELDQYQLDLSMEKLRLKMLEPYVTGILNPLDGFLYGKVHMGGLINKPEFEGELVLKRSKLGVEVLNTVYNIDGDAIVDVRKDGIKVQSMVLRDETQEADRFGLVKGGINHDNFSNITFDLSIDMNQIMCLNTTAKDNDLYYGQAYGSGTYKLTGSPSNLVMDIVAKTESGTKFHLPMESSSDLGNNEFVQFVGATTLAEDKPSYTANLSGIQLNFDLDVGEETEVEIIFDASVGDVLHAKGNANLQLEISTLGQFNMYGNYLIKEGDYLFTLERVVNKKLKIQEGGSILFAGDPYHAKLNVNAVYERRISVYPLQLIADTSNAKIPVEVILNIQDELSSPVITPSFNLPNATDNLRSEFEDRIRDESELNKQVFAVLVLNQFVPTQGLGGIDFAQGGSSNLSELLSNQLSNVLSQFGDNYDLGFAYRDGNKELGTSNELEVNFSYQFFNDRLSLNGNVGVPFDQTTSSLVGDFFVEYDLTKDRRFKLKAYNRNNQYDPLLDNTSTTYGLGINYNRDFDKWSELWKKAREKK